MTGQAYIPVFSRLFDIGDAALRAMGTACPAMRVGSRFLWLAGGVGGKYQRVNKLEPKIQDERLALVMTPDFWQELKC